MFFTPFTLAAKLKALACVLSKGPPSVKAVNKHRWTLNPSPGVPTSQKNRCKSALLEAPVVDKT